MSISLVLRELERRLEPQRIYEGLLPFQRIFVDSKKRFRAIISPRRASKSWTVCSALIICCLLKHNTRCLYLGLTRNSAKRVAWDHIHTILREYNINFVPNKVDLTITFDNGSVIELSGADSTTDAVERFLGAAYSMVVIDESASFSPLVLDYLIDTVLGPTLIDYSGILILVGTPRAIEAGRFYTVTTTHPDRWDIFEWQTEDNIYVRDQWLAEIAELKRINPNIENEAWFQREYMGKWAKDQKDTVYRFSHNNLIPVAPQQIYTYCLGVDIGWTDACGFAVSGWAKHDPKFYGFESYKKSEMLPSDIANQIKYYEASYQPLYVVADAANKTVIEELRRRYGLSITAAEKFKKQDYIEIMNTDFMLNNICIVQDKNAALIKELTDLVWNIRSNGEREEHPAFENHLCDSLLYSYRYAYHYKEKPKVILSEEDKIFNQQKLIAMRKAKQHRWEK
jgi:phage terminase large subunit